MPQETVELLPQSILAETAVMSEDTDSTDEREPQPEPVAAAPRRTARVREAPVLTIENRGEEQTEMDNDGDPNKMVGDM